MLSVKIKKLCRSLDNTFFYTKTPTSKRPEKFGDFYLRYELWAKNIQQCSPTPISNFLYTDRKYIIQFGCACL